MNDEPLLCVVRGVSVFQKPDPDDDLRVWYTADLDVDVDGAKKAYRLDNSRALGALDDIRASAGWPRGSWPNVLVPDPQDPSRPLVDEDGFCVSMTSYRRFDFDRTDRRRYVDAEIVPYAVPPGIVRQKCRGVLLGCKARITHLPTNRSIDCVTADMSGNSIGEASLAAAVFFNPKLSARAGDDQLNYLYEFWPGTPAVIGEEQYKLIPSSA